MNKGIVTVKQSNSSSQYKWVKQQVRKFITGQPQQLFTERSNIKKCVTTREKDLNKEDNQRSTILNKVGEPETVNHKYNFQDLSERVNNKLANFDQRLRIDNQTESEDKSSISHEIIGQTTKNMPSIYIGDTPTLPYEKKELMKD